MHLKISIITVVCNNVETVEDCLRSVMNQTYLNIEHIIIDGGSTDGTVEVIEARGLFEKMHGESGCDRILKRGC